MSQLPRAPQGYPVAWDGKTLYLGKLSADVKKAFAAWVKPRALAEMKAVLDGAEYSQFRQEVAGGGIFWSATPSMAVAAELNRLEGQVYLNRLLFGEHVKDWTDDELRAMLAAKDADPDSDYRVAFDLVWEEQDPKAPRPSSGSEGRTGTPTSSATSPSSTPSASPETTPAA